MMDVNNSTTCNLFTVKNTPSGARSCIHTEYCYYIEYVNCNDEDDSLQYNSISDILDMIYILLDDVFLHMLCGGTICKMYYDGRKERIYSIVVDATASGITFVRIRE